jgi:hypothetical protein
MTIFSSFEIILCEDNNLKPIKLGFGVNFVSSKVYLHFSSHLRCN